MSETSREEKERTERRFSRGLEDVSHLFLSQSPDSPSGRAGDPGSMPAQTRPDRVPSRAPFLLHNAPGVDREQILEFLHRSVAVLEEGVRVIDANIPCDSFGCIDLLAVDGRDQLCIINVEIVPKDDALLRGIACFDWIIRNTPIVRRMYQGRVINFSAEPRLFLVAPDFSPLLQCVAQRSTSPKVCCFAYRAIAMPGGDGILFERA